MVYISEEKLKLHLKLGRIVAQFIRIDTFFEGRAFDWIKLEKVNSAYCAILVRSVDEGDEYYTDIKTFHILNQ